ncbi:MAG: glycosyltransferase family 25 protein [Simkaniaceae bacterium]|nr:glycosyltransferase family 25 protein [Simkaniaceae bacterium]
MRNILIYIILFSSVYGDTIVNYLNTNYEHVKTNHSEIDALFVIGEGNSDKTKSLISMLTNAEFPVNRFTPFTHKTLSPNCIKKFVSQNVSPQLIAQYLNHFSVYKYCLENKVKCPLIVDQSAMVKKDPRRLFEIKRELEKIDPNWDVLFTDVDYHNPRSGKRIFPQISGPSGIIPNKRKLSDNISALKSRYCLTSYLISPRGMRKLLLAYKKWWPNLPYDQAFFQLPRLRTYTTNYDIITNWFSRLAPPEIKVDNRYKLNSECWMHPKKFISPARFDVLAKVIYGRSILNKQKTPWPEELYYNHIKAWNNFFEGAPYKLGFDDFKNAYISLLKSTKKNGFLASSDAVPISTGGSIQNGSHRIAACLLNDCKVKVKVTSQAKVGPLREFSAVMRNSHKLEEKYLDAMATEYLRWSPKCKILCLFPSAQAPIEKIEEIILSYGNIVYRKECQFNKTGTLELIKLIYHNEKWVGNHANGYRLGKVKASRCFPNSHPLRVFLVELPSEEAAIAVKEKIREECKIGNDSVHINDTHPQSLMIGRALFNQNSIDFMNRRKKAECTKFDRLMTQLHQFVRESQIDTETLCVDASAILSAYGLRDCQDLDLLHLGKLPKNPYEIDSHNGYLKYHSTHLDDILFNPSNHFYYQGIKFLSPKRLHDMKRARGEKKDIRDCSLLRKVL